MKSTWQKNKLYGGNFLILKKYENDLYKKGFKNIAGLDEAGRGCIAGPLVVAICVFKPDYVNKNIKDSKKITKNKRAKIFQEIIKSAIYYDYVIYDANYVDKYNPKKTSIIGMEYLVNKAKNKIDFILIDFEKINTSIDSLSIIKGDEKSQTIAAASIIAKTIRDQCMENLHQKYPIFDFINNQGYATKNHLNILNKNEPIYNVHRFSYKTVKNKIK